MRPLFVYTLVILAGAIMVSLSGRAQRWVAGEAAGVDAVAVVPAGEITGVRLEVYWPGTGKVRTVTLSDTRLDIGDQATTFAGAAAEWEAVRRAVSQIPRQWWREAAPAAPGPAGGDVLTVERGAGPARYVLTSGWEASPVDAVKEAIWQAVRARWNPPRKRRPNTEFVEPFETLRAQLRIRF